MIFRMTSRPVLLALLLGVAACGNYSNEDLEFMNAVPARDDLAVNLPPKPLSTTNEAELSAQTHDTVRGFNGLLDGVLAYVETVRSYQPTSRASDSRTWGPAAAAHEGTNDPNGWEWRFVMTRDAGYSNTFDYRFDLRPLGDPNALWTAFITGSFDAAVGVRRGNGHFLVDFKSLRDRAYPFDNDDGALAAVALTYATAEFPISVSMMFATVEGKTAQIDYKAQADGSGALDFTLVGDFILTSAIETIATTSRWLPSGAGRSDQVIQSGDGAGLHRIECWSDAFVETYSDKPWLTADQRMTGDPSLCPAISGL